MIKNVTSIFGAKPTLGIYYEGTLDLAVHTLQYAGVL